MKIKSIAQYKEIQRQRQKLLDEAHARQRARFQQKMAHEAKLDKERQLRDQVFKDAAEAIAQEIVSDMYAEEIAKQKQESEKT